MKKVIALLLVVITCFALFACNKPQEKAKKPDFSNAVELDIDAYNALKEADPKQAEKEYDGKAYKYTGTVVVIENSYCILGYEEYDLIFDFYKTYYQIKIYLEDEDLDKLKLAETYTFAGILETSFSLLKMRDGILIEE